MRFLLPLTALAFTAGCSLGSDDQERTVSVPALDWSQAERETWEDGEYAELSIDGTMKGKLPRVGEFDREGYGTVSRDSWTWDGQTTESLFVEMNTLTDDGWAMVGVSLSLDPETGIATYSLDNVIGCSGPEEDDARFDEAPDEGELTVDEIEIDGEKFVQFELTGEFRGENEVIGVAVVPAADQ